MKALTISEPYASLIARGEKWVENRTWGTPYRGVLAIHAGLGRQYLTRRELRGYPAGCIVAVCTIGACISHYDARFPIAKLKELGITLEQFYGHEHTEGPVCWILKNVIQLPTPIPAKGAQGLWTVPPDVEALIRKQVEL